MIGRTVGNYVIERELGRGSMGLVYFARHHQVGRKAAVKVLPRQHSNNREFRERLMAEFHILDRISHGKIVSLYDVCMDGDEIFLIQEYLPGRTLKAALEEGPIGLFQLTVIGQQILSGLAYVHAMGILHRDIKPANIMLTPSGAKLLDFGIAKAALAGTHTQPDIVMGSLAYIAPELWDGVPASPASDIYAFGLSLYEAVIGAPVFKSDRGQLAYINFHREGRIPDIREKRSDVDAWLAEAIHRATRRRPEERYSDGSAMLRVFHENMGFTGIMAAENPAPLSAEPPRHPIAKTESFSRILSMDDPFYTDGGAFPGESVLAPQPETDPDSVLTVVANGATSPQANGSIHGSIPAEEHSAPMEGGAAPPTEFIPLVIPYPAGKRQAPPSPRPLPTPGQDAERSPHMPRTAPLAPPPPAVPAAARASLGPVPCPPPQSPPSVVPKPTAPDPVPSAATAPPPTAVPSHRVTYGMLLVCLLALLLVAAVVGLSPKGATPLAEPLPETEAPRGSQPPDRPTGVTHLLLPVLNERSDATRMTCTDGSGAIVVDIIALVAGDSLLKISPQTVACEFLGRDGDEIAVWHPPEAISGDRLPQIVLEAQAAVRKRSDIRTPAETPPATNAPPEPTPWGGITTEPESEVAAAPPPALAQPRQALLTIVATGRPKSGILRRTREKTAVFGVDGTATSASPYTRRVDVGTHEFTMWLADERLLTCLVAVDGGGRTVTVDLQQPRCP